MRVLKPSFAADLARYGPESAATASLDEARRYTRTLAASHYENFPVLTRLLPRDLQQPVANVYAFSRWADDLGDEVEPAADSLRLLDWWKSELDRCYRGEASHPVFVALRETITDRVLPQAPLNDLISAFRQDQTVLEYDTAAAVQDYCTRSANPVGRLMLHLFEHATPENVRDSDAICTGLQLANFCQDVQRDAAIGRRYLPREELERFGVPPADLRSHTSSPAVQALLRSEVERAESFLEVGRDLPRRLPVRLRLTIDLFRRGGLAICQKIRAADFCVLEERPQVSKRDAAVAFAKSTAGLLRFRKH